MKAKPPVGRIPAALLSERFMPARRFPPPWSVELFAHHAATMFFPHFVGDARLIDAWRKKRLSEHLL
jgi:hypothetical protein